jgi:hypothetical protein
VLAPGGCQSNLRFVYKLAGLATSFQKPAATSVFTLAVSGSAMRIGNARASSTEQSAERQPISDCASAISSRRAAVRWVR